MAAGVCIRLYDEQDFKQRPAFTEPEILRSSLASVILRMKSLRLTDVETFPFIEPPLDRAIADGYQLLQELGAMDDNNQLTAVGRELARCRSIRVGRMILAARDNHALDECRLLQPPCRCKIHVIAPWMHKAQPTSPIRSLLMRNQSSFLISRFGNGLKRRLSTRKSNRQLQENCRAQFLNRRFARMA